VAVAIIKLPPLHQREGDLGLLVDDIMTKINRESISDPAWTHKKLSVSAKNVLLNHAWQGNIRELVNTLTRTCIWSDNEILTEEDIRDALLVRPKKTESTETILYRNVEDGLDLQELIAEVAEHYLNRVLKLTAHNKTKAAELLKFANYQTLNNWIKKYNIKL
jgi:transcriptional regulator with PAS, ATPase and Fis domain